MSLPEIALGPTPSEHDLAPYLMGRPEAEEHGRRNIERTLAEMQWRLELRERDPDAFLVAFSTDAFPALGFRTYEAYRASALWKRIKREELRKAGGRCAACGKFTLTIHHRDYRPRVLRGEDRAALIALCQPCHDRVHFADAAKKEERSWNGSEEILREMVERASAKK